MSSPTDMEVEPAAASSMDTKHADTTEAKATKQQSMEPHVKCTLTKEEIYQRDGLRSFDNCGVCERLGVLCMVGLHPQGASQTNQPSSGTVCTDTMMRVCRACGCVALAVVYSVPGLAMGVDWLRVVRFLWRFLWRFLLCA